jgi:hypothetical protein
LGTPVSAKSLKIANLGAEGFPLESAVRVSSIKNRIKKHSGKYLNDHRKFSFRCYFVTFFIARRNFAMPRFFFIRLLVVGAYVGLAFS